MARRLAVLLFAVGASAVQNETLQNANGSEAGNETQTQTLELMSQENASGIEAGNETEMQTLELMPRNASFASLQAEEYVAGGSLRLTWQDCGAESWVPMAATISGFTPDQIPLGVKTTMKAWGDLQRPVQSGTVEMRFRAGLFGIVSRSLKADLCKPMTLDMPSGAGSLTWRGLNCPVEAGPVSILTDIEVPSSIPQFFLRATVTIRGTSSEGLPLFCMKIRTSPNRRLESMDTASSAQETPGFLV